MKLLGTVLGNRDLARVEVAWAASSLGNWAFSILLAIYAYRQGGAGAVALSIVVRMLPAALAAPYAAMLADRRSRRALVVWSSVVRALVLAAVAAAAAGGASLAVVLAFACAFTVVNTAHRPSQAALMPRLARTPAELAAANIAWSAIDYAGFLLGGLGAGVLVGVTGPAAGLAVCAGAFAVAALVASSLPPDVPPEPQEIRSGLAELAEGMRTVARHAEIRFLMGLYSVRGIVQGVIDVLLVVAAIELLGLGESGAGWLNAAWGVGGVLGGVAALALLARGRLASGVSGGLALAGITFAAVGVTADAAGTFPLLVAMGVGFAVVESALITLTQRLAPNDVLARVFGVEETLEVASLGIGSALAAALVAAFDARGAIVVAGAVLPLLALLAARRLASTEAGAPVPELAFQLVRELPLFEPLPMATLENLAVHSEERRYQPGEPIVEQGEIGDVFHVIANGEVEVRIDGTPCARHGPGGFFGEIALLRNRPRIATVAALNPVTTLAIRREPFLSAIAGHARSTGAADAVAEERLARSRGR